VFGFRQVGRHLLQFLCLFMSRCPYRVMSSYHSTVRLGGAGTGSAPVGRFGASGDVVHCIVAKINRVDSVHSYNLPSLELTLLALMHVTARSSNNPYFGKFMRLLWKLAIIWSKFSSILDTLYVDPVWDHRPRNRSAIPTTGYGPASAEIRSNRASPSGDIQKNADTKRG